MTRLEYGVKFRFVLIFKRQKARYPHLYIETHTCGFITSNIKIIFQPCLFFLSCLSFVTKEYFNSSEDTWLQTRTLPPSPQRELQILDQPQDSQQQQQQLSRHDGTAGFIECAL